MRHRPQLEGNCSSYPPLTELLSEALAHHLSEPSARTSDVEPVYLRDLVHRLRDELCGRGAVLRLLGQHLEDQHHQLGRSIAAMFRNVERRLVQDTLRNHARVLFLVETPRRQELER